jgi:hypothetical protein
VWIADMSPRLAQSLETAFVMGGVVAVLEIIDDLDAVAVGLDDPGGFPHCWDLSQSRPDSVRPEHRASAVRTSYTSELDQIRTRRR